MSGIVCPTCETETTVSDSRGRDGYVWRRRRCLNCGEKFTTVERIVGTAPPSQVRIQAETMAIKTLIRDLGLVDEFRMAADE